MIRTLFAAALLAASAAHAQAPKPSKADLKPDPVLPKMTTTAAPAVAEVTPENTWVLDLSTGGRVKAFLRPDLAPKHVERIKTLTREGFYDGTVFHRVIEGFMAQGGDPTGIGTGGSKLPDLPAEFNELPHVRGAVAMARAGDPNSANSQFYLVLQPALKLDRNYTVFGRIFEGMQWVDAIERGEPPANPTRIVKASIGSDNVPPPDFAAMAKPAAPAPLPGVPSLFPEAGAPPQGRAAPPPPVATTPVPPSAPVDTTPPSTTPPITPPASPAPPQP